MSETKNKKALFRFLHCRKIVPSPVNIESVCLSPAELLQSLEAIEKGLEDRFALLLPYPLPVTGKAHEYKATRLEEISEIVKSLPASSPGLDNLTTGMIKIVFDLSPSDILNFINFSIENAWIQAERKVAKVIRLLKKQGAGYAIDKIRPISLTSIIVKLIERVYIGILKNR